MGVLRINGMGDAKPVRSCERCDANTSGRSVHLISVLGKPEWVCDECYTKWKQIGKR